MKNLIKVTFCIVFFFAISINLVAQKELPTERIEVVKAFDARLIDVGKLKIQPNLPKIDSAVRSYQYSVEVKQYELEYEAPKLKPLAMGREKVPNNYQHYLKGGYGMNSTIYGDLGIHYSEDEMYSVGLKYRHYSAQNEDKIDDQRILETGGEIFGQYYVTDYLAAGANVQYQVNNYGLYGYDHRVSVGPDLRDGNVKYDDLKVKFNIFNPIRTEEGFEYTADVAINKYKDNFENVENGLEVNVLGRKWINKKHPLELRIQGDLSKFTGLESNQSLNNFSAAPSFTLNKEKYKFKIGGKVVTNSDQFYFYPDAEFTLNIIGNILIPFIGATGSLQKNSFRSITTYNPYAQIAPTEINNASYYSFYGGIKGAYKTIRYRLDGGYKLVDNLAVFEQNIVDERRFDVEYDDAKIISIGGGIDADVIKDGKVGMNILKQFINMDNLNEPWHIPGFEWNAYATYKMMRDRLHLTATMDAQSGAPYRNIVTNQQDRLGGLLDISFKANYYILENAGLFVHLNNLTNNKRERWQQYPNFGFNAVGGISVRF